MTRCAQDDTLRSGSRPQIRIRLLLRRRDWEAEILLLEVRRRPNLLQRIQRARRARGLPPAKVAEATRLEPQLDPALALQQPPSLFGCRCCDRCCPSVRTYRIHRRDCPGKIVRTQLRLGLDQTHLTPTRETNRRRRRAHLRLRIERDLSATIDCRVALKRRD